MRPYVVFGSNDDGKTLVPLGEFEAADHDAAKKLARDAHGSFASYGTCPVGNWSFGKLKVKEVVDIEEMQLPFPEGHQLTVQDAIAEARDALEE